VVPRGRKTSRPVRKALRKRLDKLGAGEITNGMDIIEV